MTIQKFENYGEEAFRIEDERRVHSFLPALYKDLYAHGKKVRELYLKRFRGALPEVSQLDFRNAEEKGLFPDPEPFATWETSFQKRVERSEGRRWGKLRYMIRKRIRWPWRIGKGN